MSTINLLFKFAKPYPGLVISTIILGFSGALFNGIGTTLIVPVILKIVGQQVDLSNAPSILKAILIPFDNLPENYRLICMAGSIIFMIALKNLANYIGTLTSSTLSRKLTSDMRESGVKLLLEVDLDYYAKTKVGDLINRLGGELGRAASAIGGAIKLVIVGITILVFIGLLISISWQLTIAATFLLSLVTLVNQKMINASKVYGKILSEMSKAYSVRILEILSGMRLVRATGNEVREFQKIRKLIRDREKADFKSQMNSEAIAPVSEVLGITALLLVVFLSKTLFASQIASLSTVMLTYLLVLLRVLPLISQLNAIRNSFASTSSSVDIAVDFLSRDNKPFMAMGNNTFKGISKGIHFNHISFAYPGHEKMVLKDVDLFLPKGTTLALVGGSGAGKSTLADLLPRFYDPVSGKILIDDVNLCDFEVASLRKAMGIVSQDTFLFNDTVRNNIAYAYPEATEEEVILATKQANAYEFICKLPQGFDTLIGDRGVMLSGGQRQRLAIARALLQNPEILILDEATSALDTVSERLVQAAIDDLSRDRTTVVIAHRLSTVQNADQIAVLDQGRVVEVGTHDELLPKGGYYSRLHAMQFGKKDTSQANRQQGLVRISHEIRTRLNSTIGFLLLLNDDMADSPQERQELIAEANKSAAKILNTIDVLDDVINLQKQMQPLAEDGNNESNRDNSHYQKITNEFRNDINNIVNFLSLIADDGVDNQESERSFIQQAFQSAMHVFNHLETFEDTIQMANYEK
ncbi:ATP-binding cassette domain-containing protein [Calothrix sp. 336/3]|uniref:ATP-binding cassette domain-containing protein n=1 Tax=Calothrix sp. 336/3 TaxID=1337936 RepID=UPI0004E35FC2|nr:ATP-binding cassette domain-containing protein [Calothrix sp. 336/3]AKG21018.1 ABC transporter ATP-binding protein [Calothrix sp. 336/3]